LPEEDKPFNFNGAVGDFKFSVTPSKTDLKANESAQIKVELKGQGNLKLVKLPGISTQMAWKNTNPNTKRISELRWADSKGVFTISMPWFLRQEANSRFLEFLFLILTQRRRSIIQLNPTNCFKRAKWRRVA